jgi:hypothetical protein
MTSSEQVSAQSSEQVSDRETLINELVIDALAKASQEADLSIAETIIAEQTTTDVTSTASDMIKANTSKTKAIEVDASETVKTSAVKTSAVKTSAVNDGTVETFSVGRSIALLKTVIARSTTILECLEKILLMPIPNLHYILSCVPDECCDLSIDPILYMGFLKECSNRIENDDLAGLLLCVDIVIHVSSDRDECMKRVEVDTDENDIDTRNNKHVDRAQKKAYVLLRSCIFQLQHINHVAPLSDKTADKMIAYTQLVQNAFNTGLCAVALHDGYNIHKSNGIDCAAPKMKKYTSSTSIEYKHPVIEKLKDLLVKQYNVFVTFKNELPSANTPGKNKHS